MSALAVEPEFALACDFACLRTELDRVSEGVHDHIELRRRAWRICRCSPR